MGMITPAVYAERERERALDDSVSTEAEVPARGSFTAICNELLGFPEIEDAHRTAFFGMGDPAMDKLFGRPD